MLTEQEKVIKRLLQSNLQRTISNGDVATLEITPATSISTIQYMASNCNGTHMQTLAEALLHEDKKTNLYD